MAFLCSQQAWLLCPPISSALLENNGLTSVCSHTLYHKHCFLVTKTPCLTLDPWDSCTRHPASCPVASCRCGNVHQGRLAAVFLFLLPLQGRGCCFPHIWLSLFFWVFADVIKECQWWRTTIRQWRNQRHVPGVSRSDLFDFIAPLSTLVEFEFQHLGLGVTTGPLLPEVPSWLNPKWRSNGYGSGCHD